VLIRLGLLEVKGKQNLNVLSKALGVGVDDLSDSGQIHELLSILRLLDELEDLLQEEASVTDRNTSEADGSSLSPLVIIGGEHLGDCINDVGNTRKVGEGSNFTEGKSS